VELTFTVTPAPAAEPDQPPVSVQPTPEVEPALSPTPSPAPSPVELLEFEPADTADDPEVAVAPAELPAHILIALSKRFPGAELIEAEFSTGDEPEYGVTAEFNDELIDVSLTPEGQITEIEQSLTSGDLPEAILKWVRDQFPEATIDEAAIVEEDGTVSYEVEFTPPGQAPLEATLTMPGLESPGSIPDAPQDAVAQDSTVPIEASDEAEQADARGEQEEAAGTAAAQLEMAARDSRTGQPPSNVSASPAARSPNAPESSTNAQVPEIVRAAPLVDSTRQTAVLADLLNAIVSADSRRSLEWLPALANTLPIDIASLEQSLRKIHGELDAFADQLADSNVNDGVALQLIVVLAVLAAMELFLLESRKSRGGPVIVFNGASLSSSWSWMVGSVTRRRRRTPRRDGTP
jgi:hypothetical protein